MDTDLKRTLDEWEADWLSRNQRRPASREFLLAGDILCPECGYHMAGQTEDGGEFYCCCRNESCSEFDIKYKPPTITLERIID